MKAPENMVRGAHQTFCRIAAGIALSLSVLAALGYAQNAAAHDAVTSPFDGPSKQIGHYDLTFGVGSATPALRGDLDAICLDTRNDRVVIYANGKLITMAFGMAGNEFAQRPVELKKETPARYALLEPASKTVIGAVQLATAANNASGSSLTRMTQADIGGKHYDCFAPLGLVYLGFDILGSITLQQTQEGLVLSRHEWTSKSPAERCNVRAMARSVNNGVMAIALQKGHEPLILSVSTAEDGPHSSLTADTYGYDMIADSPTRSLMSEKVPATEVGTDVLDHLVALSACLHFAGEDSEGNPERGKMLSAAYKKNRCAQRETLQRAFLAKYSRGSAVGSTLRRWRFRDGMPMRAE